MSTEDKTAAIRREVEERADLAKAPARLSRQVVIYGVPLSEEEVEALRSAVANAAAEFGWADDSDTFLALREMLERGKK